MDIHRRRKRGQEYVQAKAKLSIYDHETGWTRWIVYILLLLLPCHHEGIYIFYFPACSLWIPPIKLPTQLLLLLLWQLDGRGWKVERVWKWEPPCRQYYVSFAILGSRVYGKLCYEDKDRLVHFPGRIFSHWKWPFQLAKDLISYAYIRENNNNLKLNVIRIVPIFSYGFI